MNEDYLWDKTGGDAEIEKLENALKTFRLQETAPPAIPKQISAAKEIKPRRRFSLLFSFGPAFASCAAAAAIVFGLWLQLAGDRIPAAQNSPVAEAVPVKNEIQQSDRAALPEGFPAQTIKIPESRHRTSVVKIRQTVPAGRQKTKALRDQKEIASDAPVLTKEEKYAYDQLMLALSITSSKLKIVRDKVDGIEEQTAVVTEER
jgi:hypothetical protein